MGLGGGVGRGLRGGGGGKVGLGYLGLATRHGLSQTPAMLSERVKRGGRGLREVGKSWGEQG